MTTTHGKFMIRVNFMGGATKCWTDTILLIPMIPMLDWYVYFDDIFVFLKLFRHVCHTRIFMPR